MANSENSVAQIILYLRPQCGGIAVLDILDNEPYVFKVAPSPEPVDIPLERIPDLSPTARLSPYTTLHDYDRTSRESTPGPYSACQRLLRLGFDTTKEPSARDFEFGSQPDSDVKVPYHGKKAYAYFRIHYNFNSGALMITALDEIKVGSTRLKSQQSLLITKTVIHCGGGFEFIVEFPDTSNCAEEYKRNYQKYAAGVGFPNATYLASSLEDLPRIGAEHRSKAILGKGTFGEVHMVLNIRDGEGFAIKVLSGGGEREMKEVNIMSRLFHENIIKYERAFKLPGGKICIVMELAVNDLETHRKARQSGRRSSYLSLPCIRSIGRQALSGLDYLHGMGFMHRDLKPQNILVTKWDAETDTPTIKLANFGLAGIGSQNQTLCGTEGYIAPEMIQADPTVKALEKQMDRWMNKIAPNRLSTYPYTNAVDIWALGKVLQELLQDVASHVSLLRGKRIPVNKEPALRLIDRMMQNDPKKRPTAAECLEDPWMATIDTSDSRLAQKRGRSPTLSTWSPTSTTGEPLRKVMRSAFSDYIATNESSTTRSMNAICSHEGYVQAPRGAPGPSDVDTKIHSLVEEGQIQRVHPHASQLNIQLEEHGRLSFTPKSYNDVLMGPPAATRDENPDLGDNAGPRGASSSMQDVARRLLVALQAEGYANNVAVAGNSTDMGVVREIISRLSIAKLQVRQESQSSVVLRLEFDHEEWTSSFPNEAQPSISHYIRSQSASPVERNDAAAAATDISRPRSYLEVTFSQSSLPSLFDQPRYQPEPLAHPDQNSVPAITLDDGQFPHPLNHGSSGLDRGNTSNISDLNQSGLESNSSWASTASKGVTYPRHYDDPEAEDSF